MLHCTVHVKPLGDTKDRTKDQSYIIHYTLRYSTTPNFYLPSGWSGLLTFSHSSWRFFFTSSICFSETNCLNTASILYWYRLWDTTMIRRLVISFTRPVVASRGCYSTLLDISPAAKSDATCLTIKESFITPSEQKSLMEEIELAVQRVKYSYDHWDDVSIV